MSGNLFEFKMIGARKACASGLGHIQQQIEALEEAVQRENPGLVFDMSRSLLESVCKAVLNEKGIHFESHGELPKLVKTVLDHLHLIPSDTTDAVSAGDSLRKISGSLIAIVQGLAELRNRFGFASHGKEPEFRGLDMAHALFVARAADALVDFLYTLHQFQFAEPEKPLEFEDNPDYNEYIDSENGEVIQIVVLENLFAFRPSEVLFTLDPRAYESYLEEFRDMNRQSGEGEL